jgi:hypothetical protein
MAASKLGPRCPYAKVATYLNAKRPKIASTFCSMACLDIPLAGLISRWDTCGARERERPARDYVGLPAPGRTVTICPDKD